jgi:subtilisin-like proprotein convertase family protein
MWILLSLLGIGGAWIFWHMENGHMLRAGRQRPLPVMSLASSAPRLTKASLAQKAAQLTASRTNLFAYRLNNTGKTLEQLLHDPHAILLENALIDSRRPLGLTFPKSLQRQGDPGAYLVQARGVDSGAFRAMLAANGAKVISYIPNNAYLVEASAGIAGTVAQNPATQAVLPYEPYYKVQSTLLGAATAQTILPRNAILTLGLFPDNAAQTISQIQNLGAQIVSEDSSPFGPVVRVMPPTDWTALADLPGVQIVEPSHTRVHANDLSRVTTGVSVDTLVATNYLDLSGLNVMVDVNDSGIDQTHPDFTLNGNAASGPSGPTRVTGQFAGDLVDTDGHGTFVAGEIAGNGSESHPPGGVNVGAAAEGSVTNADFRGKAPAAMLFAVDFHGSDSNLQAEAALTNALISNNSWVYSGDQTYDLAAASYDAATRDALPYTQGSQPVLFVFAAGNDGFGQIGGNNNTADTIDSPGTAKNVITVGALEEARNITNYVTVDGVSNQVWAGITANNFQVADFSSCGNVGIGMEGQFGRFKPDVVAPGTFVVSTRSSEWDTNAYYNPTNYDDSILTNLVVGAGQLEYFGLSIPQNAISVEIEALPFNPANTLWIYASDSDFPDPANPTSADFSETNEVLIPPDNPPNSTSATYLSEIQATVLNYAIVNSNAQDVAYDLFTQIATTNDNGDYYDVLSNMNDSLGPYYRYETGTSMAAADVSGVLALMQDYFTNHLQLQPSPALMKALLLNGARLSDAELYNLQVNNTINYEGWGLVNLPNTLPPDITTNGFNGAVASSIYFQDQSPTNALATGDLHTYTLIAQTNNEPLRLTLAWTDPPGNPVAAIKLVNSLQLTVTNTDNPTNIVVYYGNDIGEASAFNTAESPTNPVAPDTINNVQTIIIPEPLGTNYTITVKGYRVNVNAVVEQTNNIVQDYALVVSSGDGDATGSFTVVDQGTVSNPAGDQDILAIGTTNAPVDNQVLGASSPLLGTNTVSVGTNSTWASSGLITVGQTNQWHFYIVTNEAQDSAGSTADVTNAAFVTYNANTLALPRTGVYANSEANSTRTEADVDLFVTTDPTLTNLSATALSNCVNGAQIGASAGGAFNGASLGRGGEEVIVDTNSQHGEVYYVGVQSEDQMAAEYNYISLFTSVPFSQMNNSNGVETVNGNPIPAAIPSGSPAVPGFSDVLGISLQPIQIQAVIVTNVFEQVDAGDLVSSLTLDSGVGGRTTAVLMNHNSPNVPGTFPYVYDDTGTVIASTLPPNYTLHHSDGPGSLLNFVGQNVGIFSLWNYHIANSVTPFSGSVDTLSLTLIPHENPQKGITVSIPPGSWYYNYVIVPPGYTNLTVAATNLMVPPGSIPLQLYLNDGNPPTTNNFLFEAGLTNSPTGLLYPNGADPGNSISYGPPLAPGTYWIGIINGNTVAQTVYLIATLSGFQSGIPPTVTASNGPPLTPEAVTSTNIFISSTGEVASVNVGIVASYPRISDLTFTLVSPEGQEVLLMENRGGITTSNAGAMELFSNLVNSTATGGAAASTNYLAANPAGGTLPIAYNFYTLPDEMTVYDSTNPLDFNPNGPFCILDTGFINNPPAGPGSQNTQTEYTNTTSAYPPNSPGLTIIMNQFGNPYATGNGDAWTYTAGSAQTNFEYLMFTEDTNLTDTPIKFAVPPFGFDGGATNYSFSFEQATNGDYFGFTNIFDPFGGWTLPTNLTTVTTVFNLASNQDVTLTNTVVLTNNFVTVVTDPNNSLGDNFQSNYLALADGTITRSIPTIPGEQYNITFWYRGPGIAGWWRGEGNALDSANPENDGQNGSLIGRFDFPAGEVGQSFEMEDNGQPFDFAGTNSYVQIHPQYAFSTVSNAIVESSTLDVGAGGEFTIEGWINPTNVTFQQPLVEWLAGTPTNYPNVTDTNFNIVAGPFLDPATSHYYYLLGATNWTVSEAWAQSLGGHLATVDTADEENWIYDAFENYDGTNRNLWIGLTNNGATFAYASGLTNLAYTDWATNQPDNCNGNQFYVAIITATNAQSGLWEMADTNGRTCVPPFTNLIYGVAEVPALQTNGVQFWISVTNIPGTTNTITSSNGCLYANLVDITNGSHIIFSAPGLVQSNVFQHVALTYSTNSGIANLFYDGTNVASTNLGVFIPKTTGDVLLGKDMSLLTNDYYGGLMDEMSIYRRALSDAEIATIYSVSASATNGLTGKFDPAVTPAAGLAEAFVDLGGFTNVLYGLNDQWDQFTYTFIATSNSLPFSISGLQPGMLLAQFSVAQAPITNFYYFPEQSLAELTGDNAFGNWTLQIWDNRTDSLLPPDGALDSWTLQMVLQTNTPSTLDLDPNSPLTITIPPGQIVPLLITVPDWASQVENIVDSDTGPVNVFYNSSQPPTGGGTGDIEFTPISVTAPPIVQVGPTLTALSAPPLPTSPTNFYYLGVQNTNTHAVNATVEVDFNLINLTNDVIYTGTVGTNQTENYFSFTVTNGFEATFQLLKLSGNADLVVRHTPPLPTLFSSDYASFNNSNADESIYVLTNSLPVPLTNGTWYLGVIKRDAGALNYSILAKELATNSPPTVLVIPLTNNVPYTFTNEDAGAALTNFFSFQVTNPVVNGVTNYVSGLRFEVYDLNGNGDLTVQTNVPPFAPPFYQLSAQPGTVPEYIQVQTNSTLTNLAATWFLGVPNNETNPINFTIVAEIETNGAFPAFPGAQGAGAGTAGGGGIGPGFTNNTVYHVTSLADDGSFGTLRDAVTRTNRTIVFDISGVIFLQTPLVITNSFLTIAGQSAPGGGITVAGQMTELSTNHDVIIRDVRFRAGGAPLTGFEMAIAGDYTNGQIVGTWTVKSNQVSVVTDAVNAMQSSNYLALANGTISTNLTTIPGQTYAVTFGYRGPDIAGWWRGESNLVDSVYGNNGVDTNGMVAYSHAQVGLGFNFNGNPNRVIVSNAPILNFVSNQNFSMDVWIKAIPYSPVGNVASIFDKRTINGADCHGYELNLSGGSVNLHLSDNNNSDGTVWGGPYLADSTLHQLIVTLMRNSTTGIRIYVDGTLRDTYDATSVPGDLTTTVPLRIGNHSDPTYTSSWDGLIDEASLYDRALSASEVKAIYMDSTNGKFDPVEFKISPSLSLAKAQILVNGATNLIFYGNNTNWQVETATFTATSNKTAVAISGMEPGMLLDALSIAPGDSLQFNTVSNVIADHISTEWSTNNDLSALNSTNVTVQWSIIADSVHNSATNGYGSLLRNGNGTLSFHHNLYADNAYASPRLGDNLNLDFEDNVIYNWGTNAGYSMNETLTDDPNGFTNRMNYICNYLIASTNSLTNTIAFWAGTTNTWIYQTNNFIQSTNTSTNTLTYLALTGQNTGWNMFTTNATEFDREFQFPPISVDEADLAYEKVLDFAGPDMAQRDAVDTNIVGHVRTQNGSFLTTEPILSLSGSVFPNLDTDQDGIPDFWEDTFGSNPFVPSQNNVLDGSGYTELEEYLNWLAGPHALTVTNQPVGVDLMQLFGQTGNLSFFVTNAVNGSVYLTNVLNYTNVTGTLFAVTNTGTYSNSFAIFTPANNFNGTTTNYGLASFDVYVTNNTTVAYFGPVTVSVVASKVAVKVNTNIPPVITSLGFGVFDPTNSGGTDFYGPYVPDANAIGMSFVVTNINPTGGADLIVAYNRLPSLSDYDYISTNPVNEAVVIWTNSMPVPLTNGNWYVGVVDVNPSGGSVSYDFQATEYPTLYRPLFLYPTTNEVFSNIETTLFQLQCQATDTNTPPLPLTFSLLNQPANVPGATNVMTIDPNTGLINWTPNEAQGPSTNSISVNVSNGAYSDTNTFTVIVLESNLAPFWPTNVPLQTNYVINAYDLLTVMNTATDTDIPTNPLSYAMTVTPAAGNVSIDTNGIITWTPTLAQVGSNYLFTTIVTDTNPWAINSKSLSNTNYFTVTVLPPLNFTNGMPQTNTVPPGGISWVAVPVPTNAIYATNLLIYATNLQVNVWFSTNLPPTITNPHDQIIIPDATSGVRVLGTNTSPGIIPGNTYFLGVQNTNPVTIGYALTVHFGYPASSVLTNSIRISSIVHTNINGTNGFLLTWFAPSNDLFQVQWTASLSPTSWASFTSIIGYNTNAFTSPNNTQFNFFDDGTQTGGFGTIRFYRLALLQASTVILPAQTNFVVQFSTPVTVTNTASDSNPNTILTYNLVNPPAGAAIGTNGVITWANALPAGLAARFLTVATDNELPPAQATNQFTIFVAPFPAITNVSATATNVTLAWRAPTNDQFQVQWSTNLASPITWYLLPNIVTSPNGVFAFTDNNTLLTEKFYELILLP